MGVYCSIAQYRDEVQFNDVVRYSGMVQCGIELWWHIVILSGRSSEKALLCGLISLHRLSLPELERKHLIRGALLAIFVAKR